MKTISVSEFKAHALQIIEKISQTREQLVITKRGKPIAQIIPYQEQVSKARPGKLSKYLVFEKDVITPLGEELWEASR
jgi:prevent-host-death family protein